MALTQPLSFQLYSARNFPPLESQLRIVSDAGFTNVEPYGAFYDDVGEAARLFKQFGLSAKSGHFGLDAIENDLGGVVSIARTLGMDYVVAPYLQPADRPTEIGAWKSFGERLAKAAARVRGEGLKFGWHNHDFEFHALPDGSVPIEHVLTEDVLWEADLAWIVRGKADPAAWLKRYSGR